LQSEFAVLFAVCESAKNIAEVGEAGQEGGSELLLHGGAGVNLGEGEVNIQ
jgi:hypothetical protein